MNNTKKNVKKKKEDQDHLLKSELGKNESLWESVLDPGLVASLSVAFFVGGNRGHTTDYESFKRFFCLHKNKMFV